MPFLKTITQRLFGRTVIDSLDLNQNAWYIDEEQVTVTAAQLNGTSILPATSQVVDVANDDVLFLDHSGSHAAAYDSIADLMNLVCGTAADTGLSATAGVMKVDIHSVTADTPASGDLLIFSDEGSAGDPVKTVTVDNYASFVAGAVADTGISSSAGVLKVDPSDAAHAINADSFVYMTAAGVPKKDLMTDVVTSMVGAVGTTGLTHTNGIISIAPEDFAASIGADSLVYMTAAGLPKKDLISDFATSMAGEGLVGVAGQIALKDDGQTSHGGVFFTGVGDCDAVQVGAVLYPRDGAPDITLGEWTEGASATASATNLAAGINGDQRNAGGPYYVAEAIGDGVVIRALTTGTAGNVAVALTGAAPTEPSTTQNLVEGRSAKTCKVGTVYHTVTAFDALLDEFTLELPFAPDTWIVQVRNSTGVIRNDLTDTFNFDGTPLGVVVTKTGITNVAAGDIITVLAISL